jgi:large subunit ribosomal protein L10
LAISKEKKQDMVAEYVERLSQTKAVFITDYRGLTVADLTDLRIRLREVGGGFQIIKNTLFDLALQEAGMHLPKEELQGTVAVGYSFEEVPPVAKVLSDFSRESQILQIKGALLGTSFLDAGGVKGLADLPPREILLAQLLGAVQGPMANLASVLAAPMREIAQVLRARSEQGQEAAA